MPISNSSDTDANAAHGDFLSPTEVQAAIDAFDDATWVRLEEIASVHGATYRLPAEDLLQEALVRALDGRRRCPRNVDVVAFIAMTAKSVASAEIKGRRKLVLIEDPNEEFSEVAAEGRPLDEQLDDERVVGPMLAEVLALFAADEVALAVFEGTYVERMSAAEVRELTGLSATEYSTKCRLIRRRLNKHFQGEQRQ